MDNVEEMDRFLEKYNFPKLNQEEIEYLNRHMTSTEIETVIRNLPANKSSGPDSSDLAFGFRDIFDHSFNFSAYNWVAHNFYFFLVQSWKIELF